MLTISTKSLYGLKALAHLAEHPNNGVLQIKEIAAKEQIPQKYLEQIFNQLGKSSLIRSVRGKNGGYILAVDPAKITVQELLLLLEGGLELLPPTSDPHDAISVVLKKAQEALLQALSITLAELVALRLSQRNILTFDI